MTIATKNVERLDGLDRPAVRANPESFLGARGEKSVIGAAALVLCAAWWLLLQPAQTGPRLQNGFLLAFVCWSVMMLAMMLPVVTPWLTTFASLNRGRDQGGPLLSAGAFASGYFTVWAGFSLAAATLQITVLPTTVPKLWGAAALSGAGLFQFSNWKARCLDHCRSPLGFLLTHWGSGRRWAWGIGLRHGLYCLGCCWALMGLSFVLGLMNLAWMAVLTLMLCVETMAPGGKSLSRLFGVSLLSWGLLRAIS